MGRHSATPENDLGRAQRRAAARNVIAAIVALIPVLPVVIAETDLDKYPAIAAIGGALAAASRVLTHPALEAWVSAYVRDEQGDVSDRPLE